MNRLLPVLLLVWSGCAGGPLVQLAGQDYPFPPKRILKGAITVRVTGDTIDLITDRIQELLPILIGTNEHGWSCLDLDEMLANSEISFPLSLGPFNADLGVRNVAICLDLSDLQVDLIDGTSPAQITLAVSHARLAFAKPLIASGSATFLGLSADAACLIDNQLDSGGVPHAAEVSFSATATLEVDEDGAFHLGTQTESLTIHDLGVTVLEDCSLLECTDENPPADACAECTAACDIANFGADLAEFLNDFIGQALDPVLAEVLNALSGPLLEQVLGGQPLDIAAEISLSNSLGALTASARTASDLGLLMRPAPSGFQVDGEIGSAGLSLFLEGGTSASGVHECVGELGPEPEFTSGPFPSFDGVLASGQTYDVGLGVSEAFVNQAIWSLYASGGLCLALTSREIADVSGGALQLKAGDLDLVLPGLGRLAGRSSSLRLVIAPRLGVSDFPVARVLPTSSDADLLLSLSNLTVGLEAFVDADWMRVLTLQTSAIASIQVDVGSDGTLRLGVGDVTLGEVAVKAPAFEQADPASIVALAVELIIMVLDNGPLVLPFDLDQLQSLLGDIPLTVGLVDVGATGAAMDWLGLFLSIEASQ